MAQATETMDFGDARQSERISIRNYCFRVLERGDLLDLVVSPSRSVSIEALWVSIERRGIAPANGSFQLKEDGLFAMRTKSGEKAERWVGRQLAGAGHLFAAGALESPGAFVIHFDSKGQRRPDLICEICGLRVEVKKRNKDRRFRVSHSPARPFRSENNDRGWHAFVFPNFEVRYVSNEGIRRLIADGRFQAGHDSHDGWADFEAGALNAHQAPPQCGKALASSIVQKTAASKVP